MKIRVWYMPDGKIRTTVFREGVDRDKVIEKILKALPELQTATFEDIEREDMPDYKYPIDPDVKDRQRETWKRKVGGGLEIDPVKVQQIKREKLIAEEMVKIDRVDKRQKAIDNLKAAGIIS